MLIALDLGSVKGNNYLFILIIIKNSHTKELGFELWCRRRILEFFNFNYDFKLHHIIAMW